MRREKAAELILSLVTPPDIAVSTVGDLVEEASVRGDASLWPDVWRTFSSQLWRDLRSCPIRLAGLALSGLWLIPIWSVIVCFPIALLVMIGGGFLHWLGLVPVSPGAFYPPNSPWLAWIPPFLAHTAAPLLAGHKLAERSSGREIAVVFVYLIWSCAFLFLQQFMVTHHVRVEAASAALQLVTDLFVLCAAVLYRFSRLESYRTAVTA